MKTCKSRHAQQFQASVVYLAQRSAAAAAVAAVPQQQQHTACALLGVLAGLAALEAEEGAVVALVVEVAGRTRAHLSR